MERVIPQDINYDLSFHTIVFLADINSQTGGVTSLVYIAFTCYLIKDQERWNRNFIHIYENASFARYL